MKKITLLLVTALFANSLSAQFDPDTRFLFKKVWPLVAHDSIEYSLDSGSAFVADETVSIFLFPNDQIDSMAYLYQNNVETVWNGWRNGSLTTVAAFEDLQNPLDTSAIYKFYSNTSGRDSVLDTYFDDGSGNLIMDSRSLVSYNNGLIDTMSTLVDPLGTGTLVRFIDYVFHYNSNNRLDSVSILNLFAGGYLGKLYHTYDSNGKLIEFDVWELNDDNNTLEHIEKYLFDHDTADLIDEVIQMEYDSTSSSFVVEGSWKYMRRANSDISVKESKRTESVTIYPNPAKNTVKIQSAESFDSYEIVSLTGKVVAKGEITNSIDVSELHSGIYLFNLKKDDQVFIKKFQKL